MQTRGEGVKKDENIADITSGSSPTNERTNERKDSKCRTKLTPPQAPASASASLRGEAQLVGFTGALLQQWKGLESCEIRGGIPNPGTFFP